MDATWSYFYTAGRSPIYTAVDNGKVTNQRAGRYVSESRKGYKTRATQKAGLFTEGSARNSRVGRVSVVVDDPIRDSVKASRSLLTQPGPTQHVRFLIFLTRSVKSPWNE